MYDSSVRGNEAKETGESATKQRHDVMIDLSRQQSGIPDQFVTGGLDFLKSSARSSCFFSRS